MLQSLTIENFKCFEHLELKDLGQFNLITGRNNVGKSSILEAILFISGADNPSITKFIGDLRQFHEDEFYWKSYFHNYDSSVAPEIKCDFSLKDSKLVVSNRVLAINSLTRKQVQSNIYKKTNEDILDINYNPTPKEELETFGLKTELVLDDGQSTISNLISFKGGLKNDKNGARYRELVTLPLEHKEDKNSYYQYSVYYLRPGDSFDKIAFFYRAFDGLSQDKALKKIVIDQLNKIETKLTIKDFFLNSNLTVYCEVDEFPHPIPIKTMGTGFQSMFVVMTLLAIYNDGVLLIDEIDSGLHYSSQKIMWQGLLSIAEKLDIQLFITTHSMECVKAFSEVANEGKGFEARLINLVKHPDKPHLPLMYNNEQMKDILHSGMGLT